MSGQAGLITVSAWLSRILLRYRMIALTPLMLLATSRNPSGSPERRRGGVSSLSVADEAIELFADRAHRARPLLTTASPR